MTNNVNQSKPAICFINQSYILSPESLQRIVAAVQIGISRDFAPLWGADASLYIAAQPAHSSHWPFYIKDRSDESGDLGYHYDSGVPTANVFCLDTLNDGCLISVTIDHETKEMLADPTADSLIDRVLNGERITYIKEVCDPVESDADGYDQDGIRLSNFVLPPYFGMPSLFPQQWPPTIFDFCRQLTSGLPSLRPGGYCEYMKNGIWQSHMARRGDQRYSPRALKSFGRRAFRRARLAAAE